MPKLTNVRFLSLAFFQVLREEFQLAIERLPPERVPERFSFVVTYTGAPSFAAELIRPGHLVGYRLDFRGRDVSMVIGLDPGTTGDMTAVLPCADAAALQIPSGPEFTAYMQKALAEGRIKHIGSTEKLGIDMRALHDAMLERGVYGHVKANAG
jgi:hypothetical protein